MKLRAKGKALCTLYPYRGFFTALVVLGYGACDTFSLLREEFCPTIRDLFDNTRIFNGTKWLMVTVVDEPTLRGALRLLRLRVDSFTK